MFVLKIIRGAGVFLQHHRSEIEIADYPQAPVVDVVHKGIAVPGLEAGKEVYLFKSLEHHIAGVGLVFLLIVFVDPLAGFIGFAVKIRRGIIHREIGQFILF